MASWSWFGVAVATLVVVLVAAWQFHREGDGQAARRLAAMAPWLALPWVGAAWFPWLGWTLLGLATLAGVALLLPLGPRPRPRGDVSGRLDERDTMFSRAALEPGTEAFETHYRRRPEQRAVDDAWRARPGLLAAESSLYDRLQFEAADASFRTVEALQSRVEGEPAADRHTLPAAEASAFLCGWVRKLGALDVGVCALRPEHLYHTGGRGDRRDQAVDCEHTWAVAFTVPMDKHALDHAPAGPVVMESAQQYLAAGAIAVQLAEWVIGLGWPARAHIDGNYLVCCPLVARDAGLGEIGRMGLLMTPGQGPRVRLAVVTCDLPLEASPVRHDPTVEDFCRICEKCADVCPSNAIASGEPPLAGEGHRWQIDQEACFGLWCEVGTDCGRCVQSCPYSHPDTWLHRPVRWLIGRSRLARKAALMADDALYGRLPASLRPRGWYLGRR